MRIRHAALAALLCLAAAPTLARGSFKGANGKLAFEGDPSRPGAPKAGIWLMNPDGSGAARLTGSVILTAQSDPAFSSDGRWVAYAEGLDVWVAPADGKVHPRQLTKLTADDRQPAFSRGGRRIAFVRSSVGSGDIFTVNFDGTHAVNVSNDPARVDDQPDWSPDGKLIAYAADPCSPGGPGGPCVFVMNGDGTRKVNLTPEEQQSNGCAPAHHSDSPTWSPDGTRIAFAACGDIWVMDADGSHKVDITADPSSQDGQPAWSPDGGSIAFAGSRDGAAGIFRTGAAAGAPVTRLTTGQDGDPSWGPSPVSIAPCTALGSPGPDTLEGTNRRDHLCGDAGDDVLDGLRGGDRLVGGPGADKLVGAEGADTLEGGSGNDTLIGGAGGDRLVGGPGSDRLIGGPGRNSYDAGPGNDRVNAVNGRSETIRCGPGRDYARADPRDNLIGCERVVLVG